MAELVAQVGLSPAARVVACRPAPRRRARDDPTERPRDVLPSPARSLQRVRGRQAAILGLAGPAGDDSRPRARRPRDRLARQPGAPCRVRGLAVPIALALRPTGPHAQRPDRARLRDRGRRRPSPPRQRWIPAGLLVIFGGVFDLFDGALARATGRVSRLGAFLDSVFDRAGEAVIYLGIHRPPRRPPASARDDPRRLARWPRASWSAMPGPSRRASASRRARRWPKSASRRARSDSSS